MPSLGKSLQDTIRNLEQLRDKQAVVSDTLLAQIDRLYEQQIELIEAMIDRHTDDYLQASQAMQTAAEHAQQALDDLRKAEQCIEKVAEAIGKVGELLARVL